MPRKRLPKTEWLVLGIEVTGWNMSYGYGYTFETKHQHEEYKEDFYCYIYGKFNFISNSEKKLKQGDPIEILLLGEPQKYFTESERNYRQTADEKRISIGSIINNKKTYTAVCRIPHESLMKLSVLVSSGKAKEVDMTYTKGERSCWLIKSFSFRTYREEE